MLSDNLHTILDLLPIGITITRPRDDELVYANPAAVRLAGPSQEALYQSNGASLQALSHSDQHQTDTQEIQFTRPDGSQVWAQRTRYSIDYDGEPAYLTSLVDITHAKHESQHTATDHLKRLHQVIVQLATASHLDDLYRDAIELGQHELGFERIAWWLVDDEATTMVGTFGTDTHGNLRDERGLSNNIARNSRIQEAMQARERITVWEDVPLIDNWQVVGHGWYAMAILWDGERIVGWLAADNLLSGNPLVPHQRELLGLYGTALSHLYARLRAVQAHQESESRYQSLVNHAPLGIGLTTTDGRILGFNQTLKRQTGYSDTELSTLNVRMLYVDQARRDDLLHRLHTEGSVSDFETILQRQDGTPYHARLAATLATVQGQQVILTISEDITDRKSAEEALRHERDLSDAIINSLPGIFYLYDNQGHLVRWNNNLEVQTGFTTSEIQARHYLDWILPDERPLVSTIFQSITRGTYTGNQQEVEAHIVTKDNRQVPYYLTGSLFRMNDQIFLLGMGINMSSLKQAEAKLRANEARYRALFENANDAIFIMRDDKIIDCNSHTLVMFGVQREQIIGQTPMDFSPPVQPDGQSSIEKGHDKIRAALDDRAQRFDWQHTRRDGTVFEAEVSLNRLALRGETLLQAVVRDITQRKQAEAALTYHRDLHRLVTTLASEFITLPPDEIDAAINHALTSVGVFLGALQLSIEQFSPDMTTFSRTYEWCAPGIEPRIQAMQNIPSHLMLWSVERFQRGESVIIPDVDQMSPEMATVRQVLKRRAARSAVAVPLMGEAGCIGFVVTYLPDVQPMNIGDVQNLLQVVGEIVVNALDRKTTQLRLDYYAQFQRLITSLATEFINLPLYQIDDGIQRALGTVSEFVNIDRAGIDLFLGNTLTRAYEWCAPGIPSRIDELQAEPMTSLGWAMQRYLRLEDVVISNLGALPEDAAIEREFLEFKGVQSALGVSLVQEGRAIGCAVFVTIRSQRDWSPDTVSLLKILAEIFVNAIERKQAEQDILTLNAELEARVAQRTAELMASNEQLQLEIAERERYEHALRRSEAKFRSFVEESPNGIALLDGSGRVIEWNAASEQLIGLAREQVLGRPRVDILMNILREEVRTPELRRWLEETTQQMVDTGQIPLEQPEETIIQRPDGTLRHIHSSAFPIQTGDGYMIGYIVYDITERKRAEATLRQSEANLRAILEAIPIPLTVSGHDGTVFYANPKAMMLFGFDISDLPHYNVLDLHFTPVNGERLVQHVLQYGQMRNEEFLLRQFDGSQMWGLVSVQPVIYGGQPAFLGAVVDITERKRAEKVEQEQRALAEALLDTAAGLTSTLDVDQLFERIFANVQHVVSYDTAVILLADDHHMQLAAQRGYTLQNNAISTLHLALVADHSAPKPRIIADITAEPELDVPPAEIARSYVIIPIVLDNEIIGFLNLGSRQPAFFSNLHAQYLQIFGHQAAIAIRNARQYEQAHTLAAIKERQRIARELHDSVSQTLFSAATLAELLPRVIEKRPAKAAEYMVELEQLTRGAMAEMRTLMVELRPNSIIKTELGTLVKQLCDTFAKNTQTEARFRGIESIFLPEPVQIVFYRVAQEALSNIAKHSSATRVDVRLARTDNVVELHIEDNGQGFDQNQLLGHQFGIRNMQERAEDIGATLRITSTQGTVINLKWVEP